MLRDPLRRQFLIGATLQVVALILMITRPWIVTSIPFWLPLLLIAGVIGVWMTSRAGTAMVRCRQAQRRQERGEG